MMTVRSTSARTSSDDVGKFLLRVALAILILFHGISKVIGSVAVVSGLVVKSGLPPVLAYAVFVGEVAAPVCLLLGVWTRAAALIVAINIVVAVLLARAAQFFTISKTGGWALELEGMYFMAALAVAWLGAGRYSLGGKDGRWN
jgi:putative oxidoreductase